jgi:predicted RNA-binding Zn-ribbon protein involved in translation (DUF1610 family)
MKQRIALRQISSEGCEILTTGFLAVEASRDVEFACAGCGRTLLSVKRARLHNLIAHCTSCDTSNCLQA